MHRLLSVIAVVGPLTVQSATANLHFIALADDLYATTATINKENPIIAQAVIAKTS